MDTLQEFPPVAIENLANLVTYNPNKFAHQLLLERDNHKILIFAFSKGQELKTHTTPHKALLIMLEGICEFTMNGVTQVLTVGEVIQIPAQVPHSLAASSNFKMVLIK